MADLQTTPPAGAAMVRVSKADSLKKILEDPGIQKQFENALKENKDAFVASIIDLYVSDSKLQECSPKAVIMQALKSAVLKLPINKSLGFSWIIPYSISKPDVDEAGVQKIDPKTNRGLWKKVMEPQQQIGYKGYIQLALRTNQYRFINTDVVYEGQIEKRNRLTGEILINDSEPKEGAKPVGYFAYIELLNGFSKIFYSTEKEVRAHAKKHSKSYKPEDAKNIWAQNFDEMAKKTVLAYLLSHYGYLSTEMIQAIDSEYKSDFQSDATLTNVTQNIQQNANTVDTDFDDVDDDNDAGLDQEQDEEQEQQQIGEGNQDNQVPPAATEKKEKQPISATTKKPGAGGASQSAAGPGWE